MATACAGNAAPLGAALSNDPLKIDDVTENRSRIASEARRRIFNHIEHKEHKEHKKFFKTLRTLRTSRESFPRADAPRLAFSKIFFPGVLFFKIFCFIITLT